MILVCSRSRDPPSTCTHSNPPGVIWPRRLELVPLPSSLSSSGSGACRLHPGEHGGSVERGSLHGSHAAPPSAGRPGTGTSCRQPGTWLWQGAAGSVPGVMIAEVLASSPAPAWSPLLLPPSLGGTSLQNGFSPPPVCLHQCLPPDTVLPAAGAPPYSSRMLPPKAPSSLFCKVYTLKC